MTPEASPSPPVGREALLAARHFQLPFRRQTWRGTQGNWLGVGLGSSIDFQDHRAYVPGDDPRYIHWAAYARTGQLTMKQYRAEVSPLVDLVIDVSGSMTFDPLKRARAAQLLAFCVHSADQSGAPVRAHAVNGAKVTSLPVEWVRAEHWTEIFPATVASATSPATAPRQALLPWWTGALKILISDLLFPGEPAAVLGPQAAGTGLALIFAPTLAAERELPWRGNLELRDCESTALRRQYIDGTLAERYRSAYQRHFSLWHEAAQQRGVLLATLPAEGTLTAALTGEPLRKGAVAHHR